jgi:hypothetical protein
VRVTPARREAPSGAITVFAVQLLASRSRNDAERRAAAAGRALPEVRVDHEGGLYKVRAARAADGAEARRWLKKARSLGYRDAFVVRIDANAADQSSSSDPSEAAR